MSRWRDMLCDRVDQAEAMLGYMKQNGSRIGAEPLIGALDFGGAAELGVEQVTLSFTQRVVFSVLDGDVVFRSLTAEIKRQPLRSRDGFLFFPKIGE